MKNVAIILSGGSGTRFGGDLPKQFTKLAGRAIIEYTIEAFERSQYIDEIIIVSKEAFIDRTWELIQKNNWKKISKVVAGGKERFDSTYSALLSMQNYPENTKVLFHDSVRPLITDRIIKDCVLTLDNFDAVDVVIPSADTLVEVYDDGCIANIPDRSHMRRGQTPQAFTLKTIQEAYDLAIQQNRKVFTCDCGVVRAMFPQIKVATVDGDECNLKVTTPIDLFIAEKQIHIGSRDSVENFELTGLKNKNIVIFGGTSGIGESMHKLATLSGANVYSASRSFNGVDITQKSSLIKFLEEVEEKAGKIDFIVNTVGLLIKKPLDLLTEKEISDLVAINYTGAINVAIASKPFLEKSRGMLLNFTSSSYTRGRSLYVIYTSANAGVVNLTQALAEEWESSKIKVNCINPERTKTPMRTKNFGKEDESLLLDADDVAHVSLATLLSNKTGLIVDIRKDGR